MEERHLKNQNYYWIIIIFLTVKLSDSQILETRRVLRAEERFEIISEAIK
jgi:hypothetical protein